MSTSDYVKKLREAFIAASVWCGGPNMRTNAEAEAARRYPLPLRTVAVDGNQYRVRDGVIELLHGGSWRASVHDARRVRTLYDLMQRPYEDETQGVSCTDIRGVPCEHRDCTVRPAVYVCNKCCQVVKP